MSDVPLPDDVLKDVITACPPKIACRCKIVSKRWLDMLNRKSFVQDNYSKHMKKKNLVALSSTGSLVSFVHDNLSFVSRRVLPLGAFERFGGTCEGMCLVADRGGSMYLVNPLIGDRALIIPRWEFTMPVSESYNEYSLYKSEVDGNYKVLVLSAWITQARRRPCDAGIVLDVYSTATRSWRRCVRHAFLETPFIYYLSTIIGREIYLMKTFSDGTPSSLSTLYVFDVELETMQPVETPAGISNSQLRRAVSVALDGKLGLLTGRGPRQQLWVEQIRRGGSQCWLQINLHDLNSRFWTHPISLPYPHLLVFLNDDKILSRYDAVVGSIEVADITVPPELLVGASFYSESIIDPTAIPYAD